MERGICLFLFADIMQYHGCGFAPGLPTGVNLSRFTTKMSMHMIYITRLAASTYTVTDIFRIIS